MTVVEDVALIDIAGARSKTRLRGGKHHTVLTSAVSILR